MIRVGPNEPNPTHHVKLRDRAGTEIGLILCDDSGKPAPHYNKTPVDRTALKTSSGSSSYSDFRYPYGPIVQKDWSSGRGGLDFESDSTKYFDANRITTRREGKAYLGPKEYYSKGYKSMDYSTQSRYSWYVSGYHAGPAWYPMDQTFTASSSYTMTTLWVLIRKVGTPVNDLTVTLRNSSGLITYATGTITVSSVTDVLSVWVPVTLSYALVSGTTYMIRLDESTNTTENRWEWCITAESPTGSSGLKKAYRVEAATVDNNVNYYEYKGQQYKVLSPPSGAPSVWMNGDRGMADTNSGNLGRLYDATKAWTVNQWVGCKVKIVQGQGMTEPVQERTITSNASNYLTVSPAWTLEHDPLTTEYVIIASDTWKQMTGHGLTAPVTAVLPVGEVIYFAQGESVLMRSHREYNNAGTWTDSDWRAEAANYATYLAYQPLANKIFRGQNTTSLVGVSSATPTTYATDLTFAANISVGDKYSFINGINVYPNTNGTEALWVYKEELVYIVDTDAEGIALTEMRAVRSRQNGKAAMVHNVYLYFSMGNGLERYYGGNIEDLGPNVDEGLPVDRSGPIAQLMAYPGRFFAIVDGGSTGYSSLLERSGSGWHEIYRAPFGQRLKGMALQVIPGDIDRLWLYQGNVSIWLPMCSAGVSELTDTTYTYTHEGHIILSRMHDGLFDTQKLIGWLKVWADNLNPTSLAVGKGVSIYLDYKLDEATTWTQLSGISLTSPMSTIDLSSMYGLAGKRIQIRIRFYSEDDRISPVLYAFIVEAVLRTQIKYMYTLTFRLMDNETALSAREMDGMTNAMTKLQQLEAWSDADTDSMLYMTSNSPLYDGKYVFLNPMVTRQIAADPDTTKLWTGNLFVCSTTVQEA